MLTKTDSTAAPIAQVGDLRVWWCPQLGVAEYFYVPVASALEGKRMMELLANYDLYQFENKVKPDYCNTGGLQEWDGEEWIEWESEDGLDITDISIEELD